jgi:hypothetical protein
MGQGLGCHCPGILGLLDVLDAHEEAIRYDLWPERRITDLGSEQLTWADLQMLVRQASPTSAIYRSMNPTSWMWTHTDFILALVYDKLAEHNWMISVDGSKRINRPKPLPRPGLEEDPDVKQLTGKPVPIDEMAKMLGRDSLFELHAVPDIVDAEIVDVEPVESLRGKLTAEQVLAIRSLAGQLTHADLAATYNVSESTVGRIIRRETWKHLDDLTA